MLGSTPGLGLSGKVLIFKKDDSFVYIARDRGAGLARFGLLSWKQRQLYTHNFFSLEMD